ncbi:Acetyltransferase (GNAT) family protein [compost metagenome]
MSGSIIIRKLEAKELEAAIALEQQCYSPEAAATLAAFSYRLEQYGAFFLSAWEGEELIGITNGIRTDQEACADEMKGEHSDSPNGQTFCVLTIAVRPEQRRRGVGSLLLRRLIEQCEASDIHRILLMCERHLIPFYETEQFVHHGLAGSRHGGIEWHEMSRLLHTMKHLTE